MNELKSAKALSQNLLGNFFQNAQIPGSSLHLILFKPSNRIKSLLGRRKEDQLQNTAGNMTWLEQQSN